MERIFIGVPNQPALALVGQPVSNFSHVRAVGRSRNNEIWNRRCHGIAILVLCLLAGCSAHESSVQGIVTLDGKPLTDGLVTFHPIAGGALAYGRIAPDGRYALQTGSQGGLKPGEYLVTVAANADTPQATAKNRAPIKPLITPPRYNHKETSGFKFSVVPGDNTFALELQSR